MSYRKYIEHKPESSYTQKMRDEIQLLSVSSKNMAIPFGSIIYRIQQFPGDLDLLEQIVEHDSDKEKVLIGFVRGIQRIVANIVNKRLHYYSEIKAGLDNRYDLDIGSLKDGQWKQSRNLGEIINSYYKKGLFRDKDYRILNKTIKNKTANAYDVTHNIIREYRVLRWTSDEILKGEKQLLGKKISLVEAADTVNQLFKIDEVTIIQNKLTEVTNVYFLAYIDKKGNQHDIIGPSPSAQLQLRDEIEKLYYSDMFYSPFKVFKRMFALAQMPDNRGTPIFNDVIYSLKGFISSTTSLVYQLKSELEVIELLLEKVKSPPLVTINNSLDSIKFRLASYLELSENKLEDINNLIDQAIHANIKAKLSLIDDIKKILKININYATIVYMDSVRLNPPPDFMLPTEHKYDRSIVRKPNSNPVNPMKLFS